MEDVGIFYGHLVYLRSVGIFYGNSLYFVVIRYILWPFGIFYDHLVYFPRFGMLRQEKSGNTALSALTYVQVHRSRKTLFVFHKAPGTFFFLRIRKPSETFMHFYCMANCFNFKPKKAF
jgi:hypothetical protein